MSAGAPPTMRALVLSGTGPAHLAVRTVPTPRPGAEQLLARVDAAGICTSLIKLVDQGARHPHLYGWDPAEHPLVLGDEGAVTIVEVGEALAGSYRPGQRCVVQPAVDGPPLHHRERYRDVERVRRVAVGYTLPGHLAEYLLVTEETIRAGCLLPLPDARLAHAHAALAEPISCAVSGQEHHVHLQTGGAGSLSGSPGETGRTARLGLRPEGVTVVVGAGVMGRLHVDLALASHPRALLVADLEPERLRLVERRFGRRATDVGCRLVTVPADGDVAGRLDALSGGAGADDVIVAVGSVAAAERGLALAGPGGCVSLFGGFRHGEHVVPLDGNAVHYRGLIVTGSSGGSPGDLARALDLMARDAIEPAEHITCIGDLDHAPALIEQVRKRELDGRAVLYPHRRAETVLRVDRWDRADEAAYLDEAAHPGATRPPDRA